jgi:DNA-binding FadR family transcriptional regulator
MLRSIDNFMVTEQITTIKRRRLHEEIAVQIQELVRHGTLKVGDRLPAERDLSERLGVSRASLREAMRSLELRGLVVIRPGAGTFISSDCLDSAASMIASSIIDSRAILADIFEMRRLLEPGMAGLAALRVVPADIQGMDVILTDQADQVRRGETGVDGDTAFHFAIAKGMKKRKPITEYLTRQGRFAPFTPEDTAYFQKRVDQSWEEWYIPGVIPFRPENGAS